jgi:hypothetical protein
LVRLPSVSLLPTLVAICLCAGLYAGTAQSDPLWAEEAQRLRVGLKLFPAILGALEGLGVRRSPDGNIEVVVVYTGSRQNADETASNLQQVGSIRGLPLKVRSLSVTALDHYQGPPLGGIFVASTDIGGKRLKTWSQHYRTLVFSPFDGDVEAGAVAGIYVSDQILPYLNMAQAKLAGIRFKRFLLQVARQYE